MMKGPPPGMISSPPRSVSPNLETSLSFHNIPSPPAGNLLTKGTQSPPGSKLMIKTPPKLAGSPPSNGSAPPPPLVRPAPVRPSVPTNNESNNNFSSSMASDDVVFHEEGKETSPPVQVPQNAPSESDSTVFQEEPDEATAAPAANASTKKVVSQESSVVSSVPQKGDRAKETPAESVSNGRPSSRGSAAESKRESEHRERHERREKREKRDKKERRSKHHKSRRHRKRESSSESSSSSSRHSQTPSTRTPPQVDNTNAREAHPTNRRIDDGVQPLFPEAALVPMALTSTLRNKIAEEFLSILCPQQYYGRVKKINNIRPIRSNRDLATGLRTNNSIFVATKGSLPNPYFYPQLRLEENDGHLANDGDEVAAKDTPIILYEAAPGIMLFAESELEAKRLLAESENATSCFVLDCSCILFKDPEHYVLPVAMLNVRWVPYSTPYSEPQCPIHKKELQLFDPYSKELVCALCANNNDANKSKLVVIPDVLSGDSRRKIQESVSRQLDKAQRNAKLWLGQHQRIAKVADDRKEAINQQFNFFLSIVEAKRSQFLESCDAEFGLALSDVAREILLSDEKVQLLSAASDHLRTEATKPLYSMQIATIAEALDASDKYYNNFDRSNLQIPVSTQTLPNLEAAISSIQQLSPFAPPSTSRGLGTKTRQKSTGVTNSPYQTPTKLTLPDRARRPKKLSTLPSREREVVEEEEVYFSPPKEDEQDDRPSLRSRHSRNTTRRRSRTPPQQLHKGALVQSPQRPAPSPSASSPQKHNQRKISRAEAKQLFATDALSVPNSTGTSLFDYALNDLFFDASDSGSTTRTLKPIVVEWCFRVEDPGDWVGIGVGVGSTIEQWEQGRRNDLSHLWIVPYSSTKQTYLVRITVNPNTGHAKLSIHDTRGRQLDDGNVPQWNSSRICYPQVTFGGRVGRVRMTEIPHLGLNLSPLFL